MGEAGRLFDGRGLSVVPPGGGAVFDTDGHLGRPGRPVVVFGELGHGLSEAHPHGKHEGGQGAHECALQQTEST